MVTQKSFLLSTHFILLNMVSANGFLHKKLILFAACFWPSVSMLFVALFGFLNRTILSGKGNKSFETNNSAFLELDSNSIEKEDETKEKEDETKEPEADVAEFKDTRENNDLEGKESPELFFKFEFQTYRENYEPTLLESAPSTSTNKYEFLSTKDFSHYLEEPEVVSLTVKELYADFNDAFFGNKEIIDDKFLSNEDSVEQKAEAESVHEEIEENSADIAHKQEVIQELEAETFGAEETEKLEAEISTEESISVKGKAVYVENNALSDDDVLRVDAHFLSDKDLFALDSDSCSVTSSHKVMSRVVASTSDGFLSDTDFEDTFELDNLGDIDGEKVESTEEDLELEYMNLQNSSTGYEADDFDEEDSDILEELQKIEESNLQNSGNIGTDKLPDKDFRDDNNSKQEELSWNDNDGKDNLDNIEQSNSQNSFSWDSEDSNELETLWEHQDLIEQLKMELKKVRATGLPTILEDDECPKIMEDLKPWKIDEKFQHEDRMGELHKFYKSYRERMRKFDILNYQKMYAMRFIQSKDPLQSISSQKASAPALTSLLLQKFLLYKRKKSSSDPMMNFIRELHSDLEMVYVGQMCLSWEILHWQYGKALELWDSDPYGIRRYNEVADEFQQFQVLMQRFIENEPFEGPRVQNYIKNRCVFRNLLQVPVIREDGSKDKKARRKGKEDDAITSDMLVEIMEESIRIFWRFVRADKDAHTVIQKGRKGNQVEPQDPTELELLSEVRTSLHKKEKKLKDILRSGNCILRKFQKHQEDSSDQVLFFFSQVDMKLVSRVLNMSKVTADQLLWCHNKLSKINFVSRKIKVEPSFLLFPCS